MTNYTLYKYEKNVAIVRINLSKIYKISFAVKKTILLVKIIFSYKLIKQRLIYTFKIFCFTHNTYEGGNMQKIAISALQIL